MELEPAAKQAVNELGEAINSAVEKSLRVAEAIELLRELGYEPNLTLKLEIGLQKIEETSEDSSETSGFPEDFELDLTEDDVKTLRRMKIKF